MGGIRLPRLRVLDLSRLAPLKITALPTPPGSVVPGASFASSGASEPPPRDAFRIFPDPSSVPAAPFDFGAQIGHFLETIFGPRTLLGLAVRAPLWVAMGIPAEGAGPSSREIAVGQVISENVAAMQRGGPAMREAAQVVLDFARNRPEAFTWDHVIAIITVSKDAAPTWFGNRAVAALAASRRDLFTDVAVALIQSYNNDPNTKGCFKLALEALGQTVPDQNVSPPPAVPLPPPQSSPAPYASPADAFVNSLFPLQRPGGRRRPLPPELKIPPESKNPPKTTP